MSPDRDDELDDDRRAALLDRIQHQSATIGTRIPERVTVDGTELALREFVVRTKGLDAVPSEERDRVRSVRSTLRQERERRRRRLESDPLTVGEAEQLADSIVGLDRAIAALKHLRQPPTTERREDAVERDRQWIDFLKQIQK